jgi:hypothetical protein
VPLCGLSQLASDKAKADRVKATFNVTQLKLSVPRMKGDSFNNVLPTLGQDVCIVIATPSTLSIGLTPEDNDVSDFETWFSH